MLTSPGRGMLPPPTSPASEMVWCGERKGRAPMRPPSDGSSPATEWMRVVSRLSSKVIGGRIVGMRFASIVLPASGLPTSSMLWTLFGRIDYVGCESQDVYEVWDSEVSQTLMSRGSLDT